MERLQKIMAQAGIGSRRHCEQIILDGQVKVNGSVVTTLPVLVDPQVDRIVIGRRALRLEPKVYFLLNKPRKVVCTNSDPEGRRRAIDLLTGVKQRVYPVGRLDADSTGLLILTNDGELANKLTHPSYGVSKTYVAQIDGSVSPEDIAKLKKGLHLDRSSRATMSQIKILRRGPKQSLLEIQLREGRNRQIRRMLLRLGFHVQRLNRIRIGRLTARGLSPGKFRALTTAEVAALARAAAPGVKKTAAKTRVKKTRAK